MKLFLPNTFFVLVSFCTVVFSSCTFGKVYTYDIRLERPASSQDLRFENDSLSISFKFYPTFIEFELYNKLDEALKINWKDVSLSINGDTKIAVPSYTYTGGFTGNALSMVAPRSTIRDIISSFNKDGFSNPPGIGPQGHLNTYPVRDNNWGPDRNYILGLKGKKVVIYLPYYLKDIYCSKTFEFLIADVQPKN
jgi:hypothetical protein